MIMLCGDRDETDDNMVSECSKLVQMQYKKRRYWMEKVVL